jgi:hypothetical protein
LQEENMAVPLPDDVINALREKSKKLTSAAAALRAAGDYADATLADQEALNCENRANAIAAGIASIRNFPSAAQLQQLANDCADLQRAIDTAAGANALAAAALKVMGDDPTDD